VNDGFAADPLLVKYWGNVKNGSGVSISGKGNFKIAIVNQHSKPSWEYCILSQQWRDNG
jgi:hypothetical protein